MLRATDLVCSFRARLVVTHTNGLVSFVGIFNNVIQQKMSLVMRQSLCLIIVKTFFVVLVSTFYHLTRVYYETTKLTPEVAVTQAGSFQE